MIVTLSPTRQERATSLGEGGRKDRINMNKYFEVRRASENDAEAIRQITAEAFEKYCELAGLETIAALNETIEDIHKDIEEKIVLVAYIDNEVVGSVRVGINEETMDEYLSRFGVSTKYQNLGGLKQHIFFFSSSSRGQKSNTGLSELKSRYWQAMLSLKL